MTPEQRIVELEDLIRRARPLLAYNAVGPAVDCTCRQCNAARMVKEIDEKVPPVPQGEG